MRLLITGSILWALDRKPSVSTIHIIERVFHDLLYAYRSTGDVPLTEYEMERVMEALETRCYDGMQEAMKNVGLVGIEYDEDVVCDICRSVSRHYNFR